MASPYLWLSLASGAPGLGGPYLLERLAPYESIDCLGDRKPRVALAIGNRTKRECLAAAALSVPHAAGHDPAVLLYRTQRTDTVIIDCELHSLLVAPRVRGGPRPGSITYHELRYAPTHPAKIARCLYYGVLAPFSAVVLLFVADLGGLSQTAELLASWLRSSIGHGLPFWPLVVLVDTDDKIPSERALRALLVAKVLADLRISDPLRAYTAAEIGELARVRLRLHTMVAAQCASPESLRANLLRLIDQSHAERRAHGVQFSATHWTELVRLTLSQHAGQPTKPIDLCRLARLSLPPPSEMTSRLARLLQMSRAREFDMAGLVASALCLDAFPPRMHPFPPDQVFSALYDVVVADVEKLTKTAGFADIVRCKFIDAADGHLASGASFLSTHLDLLGAYQALWESNPNGDDCWVCLARDAVRTLDCRHRLCRACMSACSTESKSSEILVAACPLCLRQNTLPIYVRPATAGNRVLSLGGLSAQKTLSFLRKLQHTVGLTGLPLRRHFDTVMGAGIGVFFVLAIFLEGWTVDDCRHHINSVRKPKYSWNGSVSFGKGLKWKLDETRHANEADTVVQARRRLHANFLNKADAKSLLLGSLQDAQRESSDIFVQYDGGPVSDRLIASISAQLTACLFYIELVSPTFYRPDQECRVVLRCRIEPGPPLMDLLFKFHRGRACILYRADEGAHGRLPLCTPEILRSCQNLGRFSREIKLDVTSATSVIDIRIEDGAGRVDNVSGCPYQLGRLIRDQGLDSAFAGPYSTHVVSESGDTGMVWRSTASSAETIAVSPSSRGDDLVKEAFEQLFSTLDTFEP